jgi:hypothetical protein
MSPTPKSSKKTHALTIEFSGVCTLVWNKKAATAEVQLVDLAAIGMSRHSASLGIVIHDGNAAGIHAPDAEATVALPGVNTDVGMWSLLDTSVEIIGASGKLTVDNSKVDVTKQPSQSAESIQWLANVGVLAESAAINPACPTAATVRLTSGHITAAPVGKLRKVEFVDDGAPVAPPRYCIERFKVTVPFDDDIALRLDRRRVLRFSRSRTIVISNTCMCGLNSAPTVDDFYAHYDVVKARRRPQVRLAGSLPKIIEIPEICIVGYVEQ